MPGGTVPIYEFKCANGHTQEVIDLKREHDRVASRICSVCGQTALRVASVTNWQRGDGPGKRTSRIGKAIELVKKAEREGR